MNKNAYEIRLEVLQMANDALMALFAEKCTQLQARQTRGYDIDKCPSTFLPSVETIKARAVELYKFVEVK